MISKFKRSLYYPLWFLWMGARELFRPAGFWAWSTLIAAYISFVIFGNELPLELDSNVYLTGNHILLGFAFLFALIAFFSLPSQFSSSYLRDEDIIAAQELADGLEISEHSVKFYAFLERAEKTSMTRAKFWMGVNGVLLIFMSWIAAIENPGAFDLSMMIFLFTSFLAISLVIGFYSKASNKLFSLAYLFAFEDNDRNEVS